MYTLMLTDTEKKQGTPSYEWFFLILLVIGYYVWFSANTLYSTSGNHRLLEVFDGDEYNNFNVVYQALTGHTFYIKWEVYGHFYYNLALLPFSVLQKIMPITDTMLIYFQRLQSTVFAAATVIITFRLARRYFGRLTAWTASMLLMIAPFEFNYWSVTSHPDTLQMFLLMGGLLACFEYVSSQKNKWLIVSSFWAGLAFATKYAGIFLLPIIWLLGLGIFDTLGKFPALDFLRSQRIKSSFRLVLYTTVVFLAAFIVASPYSLVNEQFIKGIQIQSSFTSAGDIFLTNNNRFEWFEILASPYLMGGTYGILLLLALISFLVKAWNTKGANLISFKGLLWVWVLFFFTYAFFRVNLRHVRYMLVILPSLYILLGLFFAEVLEYARERIQRQSVNLLAAAMIVLVCVPGIWGGFTRQVELIETRQTREINSPAIQAGEWLENNYSPSTRILYDKYSYIPPVFTRVWGTYNMDASLINNFRPRVIVINPAIRDIFRDPSVADTYARGAEKYMASYEFYRLMEAEELGYILIAEFSGIRVYEKER